ncbi:MAG: hypothetical protein IPH74_15710 [Bacteroidetes bacterium]|nr:hypothetical protein [Bacteroidota bacterium]
MVGIYKGAFKNGQKNGIGTLYDTNGKAIKRGKWMDDNFVKINLFLRNIYL